MNKWNSAYLDFVRLFSALLVFVGHLNFSYLIGPIFGIISLPGYGPDAVMVFFVLSGFIIAEVVRKRESILSDYITARLSRLYSIAWPALVLTIIFDLIGRSINPEYYFGAWWYADTRPIIRFFVNVSLLNQIWNIDAVPFSNGPFWSLGYELLFYMLFIPIGFKFKYRKLLFSLLCLLSGPVVLMLFPIWLSGYYLNRFVKNSNISAAAAWTCLTASIAIYTAYKYFGETGYLTKYLFRDSISILNHLGRSNHFVDNYFVAGLILLNFVGAFSLLKSIPDSRMPAKAYQINRTIALGTFAIYAVHFPVLHCIAAIYDHLGISPSRATDAFMILVPLVLAVIVTSFGNRLRAQLTTYIELLFSARWLVERSGTAKLNSAVNGNTRLAFLQYPSVSAELAPAPDLRSPRG